MLTKDDRVLILTHLATVGYTLLCGHKDVAEAALENLRCFDKTDVDRVMNTLLDLGFQSLEDLRSKAPGSTTPSERN
jgi:hypothetical protein